MKTHVSFLLLIALGLAACGSTGAQNSPPPTATTVRVTAPPITPVPTLERLAQPISVTQYATRSTVIVDEPTPEPQTPTAEACLGGAALRTRHEVSAQLDYTERIVNVEQRVHYVNRGNDPLPDIVFNVEPNRYPEVFTPGSVEIMDAPVGYELAGRRLSLALSEPLQPGCALDIVLAFTLLVPPIGEGVNGYTGYFGYSPRQLNLGHWLPTVAVRYGGEWITHEVASVGEQVVSDVADWSLDLTAINAPDDLILAAPGIVEPRVNQWRVNVENSRDMTLSLSDAYNVTSRTAEDGTLVELYAFNDTLVQTDSGLVDGAVDALEWAAQAIGMYSDLFGDYPLDRYVVVEGDFPDGMEFSHIAFVGEAWFRTYTGSPQSYLAIITVHEAAHQWWFSRVGSDQALTPWLDEALATYSEYIFYEEYYPELRDWWWNFRVNTFAPPEFVGQPVDSSVYQFSSIREYINSVYLRGARMLHTLRSDLGTEAFFDWLRRYSEAWQGRVVSPDVIWSLLSPEQQAATQSTRSAYLRQ